MNEYEKHLFETDDGKVYYVNDFGDIFEIITDKEDSEKNIEQIEDNIEEIAETTLDYILINYDIDDLRDQLKDLDKKHFKEDFTEDLTSREYIKRKRRFQGTLNDITDETQQFFNSDKIDDDDKVRHFFERTQQKADQLKKEEELLQKEVYKELKKKKDLTEDITAKEFFLRKNKILFERAKPNVYIPDDEIDLDGEITETLLGYEEKEDKKKRIYTTFLETIPNYNLEC